MADVRLVVHGHFYQPPRENPWTEDVAAELSAAPFHDWNDRITAECYRPNGWARVVDDRGWVAGIINNYAHLSFNVGPTLMAWLERHRPDVSARVLEGDREGAGAIAQAYGHAILPLCNDRDLRTQVRWGLADFAHRFGRPAEGMWLPECAVDERVLAALVEEGIGFTILAPDQADGAVTGGQPYRWRHPDGQGELAIVFYDGAISHDLAFGLTGMSSQELVRRVLDAGGDGSPVCVATDGETFGHHHKFTERALAYAFAHEASAHGVRVMSAAELVRDMDPADDVGVRLSSWSCVHGVARWREDCGCSTGGEPGWNQRWRAPLRGALDLVRDHGVEVFERRGREVLADPWAARDAYIDVLLGECTTGDFLARHGTGGDPVLALTLLEAQRHALLMYTSCGWFFNDLAGIETRQVLRYAARCIDLLREAGEQPPLDAFVDTLATAQSNQPEEGDGRAVWKRHVETSRVDAGRVVAHLALVGLLERRDAPSKLACFDVVEHRREVLERGGLSGAGGRVALVHERTGRRHEQVYAAVQLGGLEVYGATRPAADRRGDAAAFERLREAVARGDRVTTFLRLIAEGFGPEEFGLESALPDAADQIVRGTADRLAQRFSDTYERLYEDNRALVGALVTTGYPLPPELRAPAEFALARRFESEIEALADPGDVGSFRDARGIVAEARTAGFHFATPRAAAIMTRTLIAATERAVTEPTESRVAAAVALLRLTRELGLEVDLDRVQELVWAAPDQAGLHPLAQALALAV